MKSCDTQIIRNHSSNKNVSNTIKYIYIMSSSLRIIIKNVFQQIMFNPSALKPAENLWNKISGHSSQIINVHVYSYL